MSRARPRGAVRQLWYGWRNACGPNDLDTLLLPRPSDVVAAQAHQRHFFPRAPQRAVPHLAAHRLLRPFEPGWLDGLVRGRRRRGRGCSSDQGKCRSRRQRVEELSPFRSCLLLPCRKLLDPLMQDFDRVHVNAVRGEWGASKRCRGASSYASGEPNARGRPLEVGSPSREMRQEAGHGTAYPYSRPRRATRSSGTTRHPAAVAMDLRHS